MLETDHCWRTFLGRFSLEHKPCAEIPPQPILQNDRATIDQIRSGDAGREIGRELIVDEGVTQLCREVADIRIVVLSAPITFPSVTIVGHAYRPASDALAAPTGVGILTDGRRC